MTPSDSIFLLQEPVKEASIVELPLCYKEGFFSKDSLLHPELPAGRAGVAGEPIPYSVRTDDVLTTLLLALTILAFIAYSNIRGFFTRQVKNFFRPPLDGTTTVRDTLTEVRFQMFIVFLTSVLFATLYYFYALHYIGDTYILDSQYYLIAIFCAIFLLYLVLKVWLYSFVNWVFFDGKRNGQWIRSLSFLITLEGLLAYPAILMGPYLNVPIQNVEIYFAIGLILVKLMTFYKCYVIFFRQNVVGLQIILYLCALEIVPLLALWEVLYITANSLKINF